MFSLIPRAITILHDYESRKMLEIRYNHVVLVRFHGYSSIILIGILTNRVSNPPISTDEVDCCLIKRAMSLLK